MPLPDFNDAGINSYFSSASQSALEDFVSDLKSDFDTAITSRFNLDEDYQNALADTPEEIKGYITDAVEHFVNSKQKYGSGTFTASGFGNGGGVPQPLDRIRIRCYIQVNGGITFGCELTKEW